MTNAGEQLKIFNLLLSAEVEKFFKYPGPLFRSRRRKMVSSKQDALFVPDFSAQPPKIINEQGSGGIMPENKVEAELSIILLWKSGLISAVLQQYAMTVGIFAFHSVN
jgi:hypothetical protein